MAQEKPKVILLGMSGVGKTSLVTRRQRKLLNINAFPTIGFAFYKLSEYVDNGIVDLSIWDTAGQERFRSMVPLYYRTSACAIIVYDCTNSDSLIRVRELANELDASVGNHGIFKILVCNKIDKYEKRVVTSAMGERLMADIGAAKHIETSALTGAGLDDLFESVARHMSSVTPPSTSDLENSIKLKEERKKTTKCCVIL